MSVRVAINGFGRIGRNFFRTAFDHPGLEVIAINDLGDARVLAHLLQYDSVHGQFDHDVQYEQHALLIAGRKIPITQERDPSKLPWKALNIDIVVEATGHFVDRAGAQKHINAGAKKVLISAPAKDPDVTIVLGVNEGDYKNDQHHIFSNASCTTNCLAPVAKVLDDSFGIESGLMTTIHSYTNDQQLLDHNHKDLRRARAAAHSIIPTTTGAARAISAVLPNLAGKLDGMSFRVPTPNVSVVDLAVRLKVDTTKEAIQEALKNAANNELKGIMQYTEAPLVSIDINGNAHSSIVDGTLTNVVQNRMAKVVAWYDNEWGYSTRLRDMILFVGKQA